MKRTLTLLAVAGLSLAAGPRADARSTQTYYYLATGSGGVLDVVSRVNTPAGRVAPQGNATFVATADHFSVTVDDAAALPGKLIEVWIGSAAGGAWRCVPDSEAVNVAAVPGTIYDVSLHDQIYPQCGAASGGTSGTITVLA